MLISRHLRLHHAFRRHKVNIAHLLEYAILRGSYAVASATPLPVLRAFFRGVGELAHALGIRRRIVAANIGAALGREATEAEVARIARRCYLEFGRMIAESVKPEPLIRNHREAFAIAGLDLLEDASRRGKGVILLTGHVGSYVVAGHIMGHLGVRMAYVSKMLNNEYVRDEALKLYGKYGNRIIPIHAFKNDPAGGLKIFRSLKKGETVVIINDQDAGSDGYRSTFFGLPTYIPSGPAHFAFKTGAAVLTGFVVRKGGRIVVEIHGPIDYSAAATPADAERMILDEYSRRLEETVRRFPEQYFWFHKKWKSSPEIRSMYRGSR